MAYVGKAKPKGTVSMRVFDKDHKLITDLGVMAGGNLTKAEKKEQKKKLDKLEKARLKEERHGG